LALEELISAYRACRICRDAPRFGVALPQEPRPIVQISASARLCIASQAPGIRAHQSGTPFADPSGERLRHWLGIGPEIFYDASRIAITPMGGCFPGHDANGGDLPELRLILLIGQYAMRWHLGPLAGGLTETVRDWRRILAEPRSPRLLPLPHPSWRNNGWLKRHPWFDAELLPVLRQAVAECL
jgi:uracil-DNA glycosylase